MEEEKIELFQKTNELLLAGKIDSAIDQIYNTIDELLLAGKFLEVDYILERLQENMVELDLLLGYLTITLAAKSKLKKRAELYQKVLELCKNEDPLLLYGLE